MEYFNSMENILWLIWLGVGVAFIIAELMVPAFIVIFFGVGALIAGATAFFGSSLQVQLVVFGVSSLALILLLRRTMARVFTGDAAEDEEETDLAIGKVAEVVEAIGPPQPGRIKFQGSFWTARSHEAVPAGSMVRIIKRDNADKTAFLVEKEN
jgi:membrane protein implicated in regulation of membrane protease activity